jgi:RimJ/RimL family protein N-acetyltransferase/predicted enzyme related to lactoylglutathione lyase
MPELEIRPIAPDDAEAVWRIRRQPGVIETTMGLPSERLGRRRRWIEDLGDDDHMFVAVRHGEVVGVAGLHVAAGRRRHVGELGVAVAPAHQRKGVGTALMGALLELADGWLGLRRVELQVVADNERARRLYERLGFEVEGRLRGFFVSEGRLLDVWAMARLRPALERGAEPPRAAAPAARAATGAVSFVELGVEDSERGRAFYSGLFGWGFEPGPHEGWTVALPNAGGGMHGGDKGASPYVFFAVADIDAALARVRELGGSVDDGDVEGDAGSVARFGRFKLCRDDQGSPFGLHQPPLAG